MDMKTFAPLTQPKELDFFTIYEENGIKYIHIFGYSYESDGYWANMECSWFIFPVSEFIANLEEYGDFVDETYQGLNQYQDELTAERMTEVINGYFDGKPADAYLDFSEITMDTPCGNYVKE